MSPASRQPTLLIFVDAFPHSLLAEGGFYIAEIGRSGPVTPGFGFSINVFPEMFAGRSPDDLGALNKWQPQTGAPTRGALEMAVRRSVDRATRRPQLLSRLVHKIYERATRDGNLANIPFELLPMYERAAVPSVRYVFQDAGMTEVRHTDFRGDVQGRDRQVMAGARKAVAADSQVFVSFGSLDHVGHRVGRSAAGFRAHAELLDGWCRELIDVFAARHPNGYHVVLCSDHGMADVDRTADAGLRTRFGAPSPDRYVYFLDANMLRVWSDDARLTDEVGAFLRARGDGVLLTPAQRELYGIASPSFGRHVFVLDEGAVFWPGWYGGYFPRGMHGYMPDLQSQQAIFVHAGTADVPDRPLPARSRDIHGYLQDLHGLTRAEQHHG